MDDVIELVGSPGMALLPSLPLDHDINHCNNRFSISIFIKPRGGRLVIIFSYQSQEWIGTPIRHRTFLRTYRLLRRNFLGNTHSRE